MMMANGKGTLTHRHTQKHTHQYTKSMIDEIVSI